MALSDDQLAEVAFLSGFNPDGTLAATSFHTWNFNAPPTYSSTSTEDKWGGTTAGTAGGTVTYAFAKNITATQQAAFEAGLQLWQDEASISFTQVAKVATADFKFERNSNNTSSYDAQFASHLVGSTTVAEPDASPQPHISIDTASGGFGTFKDNFSDGGRSFSVLVHEEGHMLGLGHAGPYNGSGNAHFTYQLTPYDSRQYSDMSYNEPSNITPAAKYDPTIDTAAWGSNDESTPMELDVLAAQRLYGAPTTGALTQAQTFGFNCTITDQTKTFFDFSNYTGGAAPVLTIYDGAATGSTLDLSGYATSSKINLNQGAFSNVDGLTSNVCIAYGTKVDTAIGGAGNDTFTVNADSDAINGGAGSNAADFAGSRSAYTIVQTGNGAGSVTNNATGAADTLTNIQTLNFADQSVSLVCFCTGTRIRTETGHVAVEELVVGDLAVTACGALRPIAWIGHRTIREPGSASWPVRVAAGAFGVGLPTRDLFMSPGHPVLVGADADGDGGHLVPIMCLVNGTTIDRVAFDEVTYWHVELDCHDILFAEGLAAESYLDWGDRGFFVEGCDHALVNPDFVVPGLAGRCRPVALDGPVVEAERRRLDGVFAMRLVRAAAWPDAGLSLAL